MQLPVVAITGGASGIGLATAQAYAAAGFPVAIGGRREEAIQKAIAEMPAGSVVIGRTLDVANRENVNHFFDWVGQKLGSVGILIQAAGINFKNRSMAAMSPEQWDEAIAINATGAYNCMHAVLPAMRERKEGLIINISSVAGERAIALGGIAYSASKFAMTALGTCVANEVASEGVRVTNVYPGEVNTPLLEQRPNPVSDEHRLSILQPEDIAQVILSIAQFPGRVHIPEIVIKPIQQNWF